MDEKITACHSCEHPAHYGKPCSFNGNCNCSGAFPQPNKDISEIHKAAYESISKEIGETKLKDSPREPIALALGTFEIHRANIEKAMWLSRMIASAISSEDNLIPSHIFGWITDITGNVSVAPEMLPPQATSSKNNLNSVSHNLMHEYFDEMRCELMTVVLAAHAANVADGEKPPMSEAELEAFPKDKISPAFFIIMSAPNLKSQAILQRYSIVNGKAVMEKPVLVDFTEDPAARLPFTYDLTEGTKKECTRLRLIHEEHEAREAATSKEEVKFTLPLNKSASSRGN